MTTLDAKTTSSGGHAEASAGGDGLNLLELIPDLFERYFRFFRVGHLEGVVPARVKELARLKIAALNECDT